MRMRPRSIRARDTLVAAVIAALALGVTAIGADVAVRSAVTAELLRRTQVDARRVSGGVRDGTLEGVIRDDTRGRVVIQVVEPGGRVTNATPSGTDRPPVSRLWPPSNMRVQDFTECRGRWPDRECLVIEAIRVSTAHDSVVVYAAARQPSYLVNGLLEAVLGAGVLMLAAVAASITWRVVGRTLGPLQPVERLVGGAGELRDLVLPRRLRQFASDASHELRTPIAGLRANLEDASMHPEDTDLRGVIQSALRDTDRLESIVTDLLLLARIGTGGSTVQEPLDLAALAAAEVGRRAFEVKIVTELAPGVMVRGVRMQLVRLLGNLLDNAERYAESRVTVEVGRRAGQALLVVTDDGIGIAPADRERVFERFTRLDTARSRDAGGAGLGLAIAREIAQAHGGTLRIEDHSSGARFALRLPLD